MLFLHFLSSEELTFENASDMHVLVKFIWSATFLKESLKNYVTETFFHEGFKIASTLSTG